jgi:hypothetical protein
MPTSVSLTVNGQAATVTVDDPGQPLLYVLRNDLELRGPRFPQSARRSLMAHQRDAQSPKDKKAENHPDPHHVRCPHAVRCRKYGHFIVDTRPAMRWVNCHQAWSDRKTGRYDPRGRIDQLAS